VLGVRLTQTCDLCANGRRKVAAITSKLPDFGDLVVVATSIRRPLCRLIRLMDFPDQDGTVALEDFLATSS
jgi:hypothetical protein